MDLGDAGDVIGSIKNLEEQQATPKRKPIALDMQDLALSDANELINNWIEKVDSGAIPQDLVEDDVAPFDPQILRVEQVEELPEDVFGMREDEYEGDEDVQLQDDAADVDPASPLGDEAEISPTEVATPMGPPSLPASLSRPQSSHDPTTLNVHRVRPLHIEDFAWELGLWCDTEGISRNAYSTLLKVLKSVKKTEDFYKLPARMDTLKENIRDSLPLMPLRSQSVTLDLSKLPTGSSPTMDFEFFDPEGLISTMLSSLEFRSKVHFGMAHFVEQQSELWHSVAWASSIRTTSGEFARYPNQKPIFPSDFILYRCGDSSCPNCTRFSTYHLGQVIAVGKNFIQSQGGQGQVTIAIRNIYDRAGLLPEIRAKLTSPPPKPPITELFVCEDEVLWVTEDAVVDRKVDMVTDNHFPTKKQPRYPSSTLWVVRQIVSIARKDVRAINLSAPIRGALEIEEFTREYLEEKFDDSGCVCLPFTMFIDGFGAWRNAYRTLTGFYITPAGLPHRERFRRSNQFVLTLAPYGSDFDDIVNAMAPFLRALDKGKIVMINGCETFICASTLAFVGDMPQQQKNAGMMSQNAKLGCRFCLVSSEQRGDLDFDIIMKARQHYGVLKLWDATYKSDNDRKTKLRPLGMLPQRPCLLNIAPALNPLDSCPPDVAHAEYGGISKAIIGILFSAVLSTQGKLQFCSILRNFQLPSGWNRLQNPMTHLKSFSMAECARISFMTPLILRFWLQARWVEEKFLAAAKKVFADDMVNYRVDAVSCIVLYFTWVARNNATLLAKSMTNSDRANLTTITVPSRRAFQQICQAAKVATAEKRSSRRNSRASSIDTSIAPTLFGEDDDDFEEVEDDDILGRADELLNNGKGTKAARQYERMVKRPNVHVGLHLAAAASQYSTLLTVSTFPGEDKHR